MKWNPIKTDIFWNGVASGSTIFHVYEEDDKFLDILSGFVGTGINADDCTIVIATTDHIDKLQERLKAHGLHIESLIDDEKYIPIHAEMILDSFMVDGIPDEKLFIESISYIINKRKSSKKHVRVFREMAPLLRAKGKLKATYQVEQFWNKYRQNESLSLFCAYPKANLIMEDCNSIKEVGYSDSKMVDNSIKISEILYRDCIY